MGRKKIETLIKEKISPYSLNEKGKSTIASLANMYSYELLCDCIDIAASSYLNYDNEGRLTKESAEDFINKILIDRFRAQTVLCGFNFRFGKNASWSALDMRNYLEKMGIWVRILG